MYLLSLHTLTNYESLHSLLLATLMINFWPFIFFYFEAESCYIVKIVHELIWTILLPQFLSAGLTGISHNHGSLFFSKH